MRDKMQDALKEAGDWMLSRELNLDDYDRVLSLTIHRISGEWVPDIHLATDAAARVVVIDNTTKRTKMGDGGSVWTHPDDGVTVSWVTE